MELRLSYEKLSSNAYKAIYSAYGSGMSGSIEKPLAEMINLRVSQINGCAYCMERHAEALRAAGETDKRIDTLAGWQLSPHFADRERAALAWAEAVTSISEGHAPEELFVSLQDHFSETQISDLTFIVSTMNALNRLAISMRR